MEPNSNGKPTFEYTNNFCKLTENFGCYPRSVWGAWRGLYRLGCFPNGFTGCCRMCLNAIEILLDAIGCNWMPLDVSVCWSVRSILHIVCWRRSVTPERRAPVSARPNAWPFLGPYKEPADRKFKFITTNWNLKIEREKNKSFWAISKTAKSPKSLLFFCPLWPKVQVRNWEDTLFSFA